MPTMTIVPCRYLLALRSFVFFRSFVFLFFFSLHLFHILEADSHRQPKEPRQSYNYHIHGQIVEITFSIRQSSQEVRAALESSPGGGGVSSGRSCRSEPDLADAVPLPPDAFEWPETKNKVTASSCTTGRSRSRGLVDGCALYLRRLLRPGG